MNVWVALVFLSLEFSDSLVHFHIISSSRDFLFVEWLRFRIMFLPLCFVCLDSGVDRRCKTEYCWKKQLICFGCWSPTSDTGVQVLTQRSTLQKWLSIVNALLYLYCSKTLVYFLYAWIILNVKKHPQMNFLHIKVVIYNSIYYSKLYKTFHHSF